MIELDAGGYYDANLSPSYLSGNNPSDSYSYYGSRLTLYIREDITIPDEPEIVLPKFTIAGVEYQYEEGMTWSNWVYSEYNTGGWKIGPSSYVISSDNTKQVRDSSGGLTFYSTPIIENEKYTAS